MDMETFVHEYGIVYETPYENDALADLARAVSVAEYARRCGDCPTSDRELAAFAMTAKRHMRAT